MNINYILEKRWVLPCAAGVAGIAAGFTAGFFIGKRNGYVEYRYDLGVDEQADDPQMSLFDALEERGEDILISTSEAEAFIEAVEAGDHVGLSVMSDYEDMLTPYSGDVQEAEDEIPPVTANVFTHILPEWDYDNEVGSRNPETPYIINREEYMLDEAGCHQETLTYYSGDDIMADQADQPITNFARLMGELRFGHGSGDPNVVYIRNEGMNREWEILLHSGRFEVEVLGNDIEAVYESQDLKHSMDRRFRLE